MLFQHQPRFLLMEFLLMLMKHFSRDKQDIQRTSLKMHHKQELKELKEESKQHKTGELKLKKFKKQLMKPFFKILRKLNT